MVRHDALVMGDSRGVGHCRARMVLLAGWQPDNGCSVGAAPAAQAPPPRRLSRLPLPPRKRRAASTAQQAPAATPRLASAARRFDVLRQAPAPAAQAPAASTTAGQAPAPAPAAPTRRRLSRLPLPPRRRRPLRRLGRLPLPPRRRPPLRRLGNPRRSRRAGARRLDGWTGAARRPSTATGARSRCASACSAERVGCRPRGAGAWRFGRPGG